MANKLTAFGIEQVFGIINKNSSTYFVAHIWNTCYPEYGYTMSYEQYCQELLLCLQEQGWLE